MPNAFEDDDNSKKESNVFTHARIPKKGLFDFVRRPIPQTVSESSKNSNMRRNVNYTKILQKKKEVNSSSSRKKYEVD
jgi:hypothetical protein